MGAADRRRFAGMYVNGKDTLRLAHDGLSAFRRVGP